VNGYADRPALGQRAVEFVTDATGRTVAEFQPRFDTLTSPPIGRIPAASCGSRHRM
jgi:hypothetical protein